MCIRDSLYTARKCCIFALNTYNPGDRMSARLLIVGLDGADGRTLDRASRDGTLPNLAEMRARGRAWALSSAQGATDDALWASFQYGADVGEHGRYSHEILTGFAVTEEFDRETFWDKLSHQGLRVAVLDVPKCRQPRPLNGICLLYTSRCV